MPADNPSASAPSLPSSAAVSPPRQRQSGAASASWSPGPVPATTPPAAPAARPQPPSAPPLVPAASAATPTPPVPAATPPPAASPKLLWQTPPPGFGTEQAASAKLKAPVFTPTGPAAHRSPGDGPAPADGFPQSHISLRVEHLRDVRPREQPRTPASGAGATPPARAAELHAEWLARRERLQRERRVAYERVSEVLPPGGGGSNISVVLSSAAQLPSQPPRQPSQPHRTPSPTRARLSPVFSPRVDLGADVFAPAPQRRVGAAVFPDGVPSPAHATAQWPALWRSVPAVQPAAMPPAVPADPALVDDPLLAELRMPDDSQPVVPAERQAELEGPPGTRREHFDWMRHPGAGPLMSLLERRGVTPATAQGAAVVERYMQPELLAGVSRMLRGMTALKYKKDGGDPAERFFFIREEECRDPGLPTGYIPYLCWANKATSTDIKGREALTELVGVQRAARDAPPSHFSPQLQPHLCANPRGTIRTIRVGSKRLVAPADLAGTLWFRQPPRDGGQHTYRPVDILTPTRDVAAVLWSVADVIRSINSPDMSFVYPPRGLQRAAAAAPAPAPAPVHVFDRAVAVGIGDGEAAVRSLQRALQAGGVSAKSWVELMSSAPPQSPQHPSTANVLQALRWAGGAEAAAGTVLVLVASKGRAGGFETADGAVPSDAFVDALTRGAPAGARIRVVCDTAGGGSAARTRREAVDLAVVSGSGKGPVGELLRAVAASLPAVLREGAPLDAALAPHLVQQRPVLYCSAAGRGQRFFVSAGPAIAAAASAPSTRAPTRTPSTGGTGSRRD
eukprot:TRINITY_DN7489_c0_g5_i1.p1 TRINITY_DN7489_c0_g5~~TRINITY_DN7489_c0_g5_i1.p1  ORF type:complete len:795 (+),score=285.09 TRINITY_DN7489_c0_g5_i1:133-2517(+)